MKRLFFYAGIFVLCQIFLSEVRLSAQTVDSAKADSVKSIIFKQKNNMPPPMSTGSQFWALPSLNIGPYSGFHDHGIYGTVLQPNLGFDLLAEPLHFLLGVRIGFSNAVTTAITLGLREPISVRKPDLNFYTDFSFLFFDDAEFVGPLKYGARLAFGARTSGSINMEYRLAGEWRGSASDITDGNRTRQLWWIGAEVGVAFSLYHDRRDRTRKELLHGSLKYIATNEELEELDEITSDAKIDKWLERFWSTRDISPKTKVNEARIEYEKRVDEANRLFSRGPVLGILTDLGRVLAIYGQPDDILDDQDLYKNSVEYQFWMYRKRIDDLTFGWFLFEQASEIEPWYQILSNVRGELNNSQIPAGLPSRLKNVIQNIN
jgi:GWxTD domain-containing protein